MGEGFWFPDLQPQVVPTQGQSGPDKAPCLLLFSLCAPGPGCPPGDAPHAGPGPASAGPVSVGHLLLLSGESHPYHSGGERDSPGGGPGTWLLPHPCPLSTRLCLDTSSAVFGLPP